MDHKRWKYSTLQIILMQSLLISYVNTSFVALKDLYTTKTTPPFELHLHYTNDGDSPILLLCSTVQSNSGLTSQPLTLPVGSKDQIATVSFSGSSTITASFEIACSIEDNSGILTRAMVQIIPQTSLWLCQRSQLIQDPVSGQVLITASLGNNEGLTLRDCTCQENDKDVLINWTTSGFSLNAVINENVCNEPLCFCTLSCSYDPDSSTFYSVNVVVMKSVFSITSSFKKLTPFTKTSTISVSTASNDIECFANKVTLDNFKTGDVIKEDSFQDIILVNSTIPGLYTVFPNVSAGTGIYGIKCQSGSFSDVFFFEYEKSNASVIEGEKLDFTKYVTVQCSCDVTSNFCDIRCCCDKDCSSVQVSILPIIGFENIIDIDIK